LPLMADDLRGEDPNAKPSSCALTSYAAIFSFMSLIASTRSPARNSSACASSFSACALSSRYVAISRSCYKAGIVGTRHLSNDCFRRLHMPLSNIEVCFRPRPCENSIRTRSEQEATSQIDLGAPIARRARVRVPPKSCSARVFTRPRPEADVALFTSWMRPVRGMPCVEASAVRPLIHTAQADAGRRSRDPQATCRERRAPPVPVCRRTRVAAPAVIAAHTGARRARIDTARCKARRLATRRLECGTTEVRNSDGTAYSSPVMGASMRSDSAVVWQVRPNWVTSYER